MIFPFKKLLLCLVAAASLNLAASTGPSESQGADPIVVMQTTKGTLAIRVFAGMAPTTARNFLDLVSRGYYDGKCFHRVETWCIQGGSNAGDPNGVFVDPSNGRPRFIPLEINGRLSHSAAGVVAMARMQNRDSGSCQFYILKKPMTQLNGQYAIFGGVVNGLNTIYGITPGDRIIHAEIASGQGGGSSFAAPTSTNRSQPSTTPTGPSGF